MAYPSRELDTMNIRLPDGLRGRIKEASAKNRRSMNAELVARLEASFEAPRSVDAEISRLIDECVNRRVTERLSEIARSLGGK